MYPDALVEKHRSRVREAGAPSLSSADDVNDVLSDFTGVIVVNSVCGCAANTLIPAVETVLPGLDLPAHQVFAGVDDDATAQARQRFGEHGPSSPAVVLLSDGTVTSYISRSDILTSEKDELENKIKSSADTV